MKRAFVTGGAGFIGSHLVHRLCRDGWRVVVLDDLSSGSPERLPETCVLVNGSVLDQPLIEQLLLDADACFHLAAIASVDECTIKYKDSHEVNLHGLINIFDVLKRNTMDVPVIYASSAAVYASKQAGLIGETDVTRPVSAYGADKLSCEIHANAAHHSFGIKSVGLRFFNVYGPWQDPRSPYAGVISRFLDLCRNGLPLTIHGSGKQTRDFVFVSDVVDAIILALEYPVNDAAVFNVCTGKSCTVNALARYVQQVVGTQVSTIEVPARVADARCSTGDPRLAANSLGFRAKVPLSQGLAELAQSVVPTPDEHPIGEP